MLIETVLIFLASVTSYHNGTSKAEPTVKVNQTEVIQATNDQINTPALRGGWDGN